MSDYQSSNVDVSILNARYEKAEQELARLKNGGGGGTFEGMTEDWKSSVDTQLTQLHADVRNLLIGGLVALTFILGAFATGFLTLDGRLDGLAVTTAKIDTKIDLLVERSKPSGAPTN